MRRIGKASLQARVQPAKKIIGALAPEEVPPAKAGPKS